MIRDDQEHNGINGMTTVSEAAKLLEVTPRRVLQFIREKRLKAQRVTSRMYLVDMAEVRRFKKLPRESGNPTFKKSRKSD